MLWNEYSYDVADARVPKKDLRENKLALYDCVFVRVTKIEHILPKTVFQCVTRLGNKWILPV